MADKVSLELLRRMNLFVESTVKDLEVKETVGVIKRTMEVSHIFERTQEIIKRAKEVVNSTADSQIYGKDN